MSRQSIALVALAHAVGAAAAFPHQPVPVTFGERIRAAIKEVEDAAADPVTAGEGGELDVGVVVEKLLADEAFAEKLVSKLAERKPSESLVKALTKTLGGDLSKLTTEFEGRLSTLSEETAKQAETFDERVTALEGFAEKVDTDVSRRLEALEDAATAGAADA